MAKKSAAQQVEQAEIVEMIESAEQLDSALQQIYAEAGVAENEAVAHVYVVEPDGSEPKIWKGPPGDYDLDTLARKFGSGNYRLVVYVKHETGRMVRKISKVIPYKLSAAEDAHLKGLRDGSIKVGAMDGVHGYNVPAQPAITAETIAAAIKAAMPAPVVVPQVNPISMMKDLAEVFRMVMPQQTAPSINPLDMLKMGVELSRRDEPTDPIDRGVNASGTDVFLRLIDKFAPLFQDAIAQKMAGQPPQLPGIVQQSGAPLPPNVQPIRNISDQPIQQPAGDDVSMRLRMGLNFLVMQAEAGNNAETYADVILDNVPENDLKEMLGKPEWLKLLAAFAPDVLKHEKWFTELKAAIEEVWKEDAPQTEVVDGDAKPAA